ncbi:uncharacterized protein LOC114525962 isoform X3 [Dendronephthya gigantea]|uniref:uncharacterized protein LOC114525962 isoform X3 n=1 Tax=Dendronephthya gigantea TaxID=151771 RepID=UPI00106D15EB|nr:uncharacterized protein LOC114525962 isoform X3 [Dendronephthya gigantea]
MKSRVRKLQKMSLLKYFKGKYSINLPENTKMSTESYSAPVQQPRRSPRLHPANISCGLKRAGSELEFDWQSKKRFAVNRNSVVYLHDESQHDPYDIKHINKDKRSKRSVPKNEWFETNIFDEKSNMKKEYKEYLLRLPGVEKIHVGFDGKKDRTWKIYITHSENSQPSMDQLRMIFGNNISCFVEFIEEKVDKNSRSAFLRGPRTGDPHHVTNEENRGRGKISILGFGDKRRQKHYAITSYHVCYQGELSGDLFEQHQKLKTDWKNNARGCSGYKYQYQGDKPRRLGEFYCGLYNDKNDIALIELDTYLDCNDAVKFLKDQRFDDVLATEKEVTEKFKNMKGTVPVGIFGSETGDRKGNLVEKDAGFENGMNDGFYGIKDVSDDNIFAEETDSGSLVYMICKDGKKIPFAYLSNIKNGVYYCPNLKSSLEALRSPVKPCLGRCGNHFNK